MQSYLHSIQTGWTLLKINSDHTSYHTQSCLRLYTTNSSHFPCGHTRCTTDPDALSYVWAPSMWSMIVFRSYTIYGQTCSTSCNQTLGSLLLQHTLSVSSSHSIFCFRCTARLLLLFFLSPSTFSLFVFFTLYYHFRTTWSFFTSFAHRSRQAHRSSRSSSTLKHDRHVN